MTESILETIRKGVQDFVAPQVRQLKADFGGLGAKFDGLRAEFDALRSEVRANPTSPDGGTAECGFTR